MTNSQLYVAFGVLFFSLLVVFVADMRGLNILASRITDVGSLIGDLGKRMDRLDSRMDQLDNRMDRPETKVDAIGTDRREFYATRRQHDTRIDALERKQGS